MHPPKNWLKELPNQLTMFRIAIGPVLLFLYPLDIHALKLICGFLFAIAGFTDWLDGFLARRYGIESKFGATLDPIADKVLTGIGLLLITHSGAVWPWLTGLLLSRELAINGLRMVAQDQGIILPVNWFGKLKMFLLDLAIVCLLVNYPLFDWPFREVGMIAIWLALLVSLYSAWIYTVEFLRQSKL